jgi:hypothetical protein
MSSKHTPGPWTLSAYYPNRVIGDRNDGEGRYVADCHCNGLNGAEQPEDAANARLIAAAPDLLEALQGMLDVYGNDGHLHAPALAALRAARAAIAKAGGTP